MKMEVEKHFCIRSWRIHNSSLIFLFRATHWILKQFVKSSTAQTIKLNTTWLGSANWSPDRVIAPSRFEIVGNTNNSGPVHTACLRLTWNSDNTLLSIHILWLLNTEGATQEVFLRRMTNSLVSARPTRQQQNTKSYCCCSQLLKMFILTHPVAKECLLSRAETVSHAHTIILSIIKLQRIMQPRNRHIPVLLLI